MNDGTRGVPFARTPEFSNRKKLQLCIAGALAAGALVAGSAADARIVSIVSISAPTVAFGGFSWPGVGQYHRITGVAYAEVDPADPALSRNKPASRKVRSCNGCPGSATVGTVLGPNA